MPRLEELGYTFGGLPPVARLRPGDVLTVDTQDCFGGLVESFEDLPSRVVDLSEVNPVSGPFFVEGAEPGDTLAVHFVDMVPTRDWGVSATVPHFGALTSTSATAGLQPPLEERVWRYDIDVEAGLARYRARRRNVTVDLPLAPMLGTVGVAPPGGEVRSTLTCDRHGGNLDTPQVRPGATLFLGINVHGALLAVGDGHARQGDGEACGVAVETSMRTTLTVGLLKDVVTPWPRIETDTAIMSVGCARPLEDAYRIAHTDLVGWVAALTGLDTLDAYQLVSQAGTAAVGNVCDPNYTMLAAIDKTYLGDRAVAYDGVHRRLRATAVATGGGGGS